jgi:hypothetical protein
MKNAAKRFASAHHQKTLIEEIKSLAPTPIDDFIAELWQLETETRNAVHTEVGDTK